MDIGFTAWKKAYDYFLLFSNHSFVWRKNMTLNFVEDDPVPRFGLLITPTRASEVVPY